ncbi:uncharacterized protein LOC111718129 [Eurytemora carolleeae]|uniref:uncharacterized protein LOC111718129 n=1 Tax=Eurytemora carolleeae TaxID=1294199 RepID=UPI000C78C201|nr:uncharacterized protein LOC111718129 [Eurytemora carolleeae]|eukprot:XP_023349406.1 uncharacterized protein LOC111718129 [Eurytemora affinis]
MLILLLYSFIILGLFLQAIWMLILFNLYWFSILTTLMLIGILIFTTTGLLAFGMITAGFIKQMENLETEVGDELARGRKCLEKFRRLKKGLSPYLFAEFSFNTFAMVVLLFMVVGVFKSKLIWPNLLILGLNTMFSGVQMLYIGVMAEETKSKFGNILPFLRSACCKQPEKQMEYLLLIQEIQLEETFSGCGFFMIEKSTLLSALGTIVTYSVVLITSDI